MRGRGTDRLVVAVMPGNSGGAKGAGCPDKRLTGPANEERYARPRSAVSPWLTQMGAVPKGSRCELLHGTEPGLVHTEPNPGCCIA